MALETNVMDVIITSSGRDTIFRTIDSFLSSVKYSGQFRFLVNIDLCQHEHLPKILEIFRGRNVKCLNINYKPQGFTSAVGFLLKRIETQFFFHLEDDWVFLKKIELDPLVELMKRDCSINRIRFTKRKIRPFNELFYVKSDFVRKYFKPRKVNMVFDGIQLVKEIAYSTNPSLCRTQHMQQLWYVNFLNIEQQFSLQNLLTFNRRGYYILGKIGDDPTVEHIG